VLDDCENAFHKLIPGAVAIRRGESVTFNRVGFHQIAIYPPGTSPSDIQILGGNRVNFPGLPGKPLVYRDPTPVTDGSYTFTTTPISETGQYLVICNITGHFQQNMWGWVQVQ
jgi:hypothetical protein